MFLYKAENIPRILMKFWTAKMKTDTATERITVWLLPGLQTLNTDELYKLQ